MKKLADIVAFLFLSSLVITSGVFVLRVQAQLNSGFDAGTASTGTADESGTSTDPNSGTNSGSGSTGDGSTDSGSSNTNSNSNTNSGSNTNQNSNTNSGSNSNQNTNTDSSTGSGDTGTNDNRNDNSNTNSNDNSNTNTDSNTNTNSSADSNTNDTNDSGVDDSKNTNDNTNTNSDSDLGSNTNTDSSTGSGDTGTNDNRNDNANTNDSTSDTPPPSDSTATDGPRDEPHDTAGDSSGPGSAEDQRREDRTVIEEHPSEQILRERVADTYKDTCLTHAFTDPRECQTFIALNLDPECRREGIRLPSRCETFLKDRYLSRLCDERNILTIDRCEEDIIDRHQDEIFCGDRDADECRTEIRRQFIGHIAAGITTRDAVRSILEERRTHHSTAADLSNALAVRGIDSDIIPIHKDSDDSLLILPSDETIHFTDDSLVELSIPFALTPDSDDDGLSNDLELLYGTDPKRADTDGDGFSDFDEIQNDYSPLEAGGEKQGRDIGPVELALLARAELEQPLVKGTASPAFRVNSVQQLPTQTGFQLSGRALPNTNVLLYIYSQMPLILMATTDNDGNWTYSLRENLNDGKHTVYVAVTNETGKLEAKSSPLAFFVQSAQAVPVTNFLTDVNVEAGYTETSLDRYYLIGAILIVAIGLLIGLFVYRIKRPTHA